MEVPQNSQGWRPSSLGGRFRRRMATLWQFQQPWTSNNSRTPYGDEKWAGGLLLDDGGRISTNSGSVRTNNSRGAYGLRRVFAFSFRVICSLLSLLWYLIPRRGVPVRKKAVHELHALAYLDALRGYGSLIIFTGHTMSRHWGWIPDILVNTAGLQFPWRGGHTCLDIFFFISGYALMYRSVGFMQTKQYDKVLDTLASSAIRRYFRLFLPVVGVTFFTMLLIPPGIVILPKHLQESLDANGGNVFMFWLNDLVRALDPFAHTASWWHKNAAGSHFLEQFWSINTEFRSSLMLFLFGMATCKMTSSKRRSLLWVCIAVSIWYEYQCAAAAFFGMLLAEHRQLGVRAAEAKKLSAVMKETQMPNSTIRDPKSSTHLRSESKSEKGYSPDSKTMMTASSLASAPHKFNYYTRQNPREVLQKLRDPFLISMFIFSFVVVRDPRETYKWDNFPHSVINFFMPEHWSSNMKVHYHMVIGMVMMVYPIDQLTSLQWPLRQPFSQYLGELSFGIYAVHYSVRFIVWEPRYLTWLRANYGKKATDHFFLLLPGYLFMTFCVLWAAELFRKMDAQIAKFCIKFEAWANS